MTIQKFFKSTHPMLRKEILSESAFDENLRTLLQDLEDTLYEEEAVAIRAPQIGMNQRVALIDMEYEGLLQLINPVILNQSHETVT